VAREIFVDTGAWLAVSDARDSYHAVAVERYRRLLREALPLVTTNLVTAEAYIAIRRTGGHPPAIRFLQFLRQSSRLTKVYSDATLEVAAEGLLAQYVDQDFSFADAVSFVVMRRRGIEEAFAFDHHFRTAGFTLLPTS